MDPVRLELTEKLCGLLGIFDPDHVSITVPDLADDQALAAVHSPEYISAIRQASADGTASPQHGVGTEDTPVFDGMHDGAARIAGGTLQLAHALHRGEITRGVNFAGGMHHATRSQAAGFCIYNDSAVALQYLLDQGISRAVYLDVDAHHGDGTQSIFYDDPRVMTISLHQTGVTLYPGTGFPNETGRGPAEGTAVNIAVPEATGDAGFLRAFHAIVPALLEAFSPEVIISQHGCDSHASDPLSDLQLSIDAQRQLALDTCQLADEHAHGRWIASGGGGYSVYDVVPRSWAHLTAVAAGSPLSLEALAPEPWRQAVLQLSDAEAPTHLGDGAQLWWRSWELGYDPEDALDRAVMQTRKEIFPLHGLDPWFD